MSDLSSEITPKTKAISVIIIVAIIVVLTVVVNFPSSETTTEQAKDKVTDTNEEVAVARSEID